MASGSHERMVISASDPGLSIAALLGGDVGYVREWVDEVLGDLAADSENDERLRETLRVFLGCGSSYKLAAEELAMHFNTVKYRVGRAEARRGRRSQRIGSLSNSRCWCAIGMAPQFSGGTRPSAIAGDNDDGELRPPRTIPRWRLCLIFRACMATW